jgi:outer membrane protein assembly factor BamB
MRERPFPSHARPSTEERARSIASLSGWSFTFFLISLVVPCLHAQLIDFETLPDGTPTEDRQFICDEYSILGVTFALLDPVTGVEVDCPRIAKAGPPRTAFQGCKDYDLPRDEQYGTSFLTDDADLGISTDLLVSYRPPVSRSSGVILDIDCRQGGPPCEEWTLQALDAAGTVLDTVVLVGPTGPNPGCIEPVGPGDSTGFGWSLDLPGEEIASVLIRYTGSATNVGRAFDHFSVAAVPGDPQVTVGGPDAEICSGQTVELEATVTGGLPPFAYQWQEETAPGVWEDLATGPHLLVTPDADRDYRVVVEDSTAAGAVSPPFTVTVVSGGAEPACAGDLLVSSYYTDRVLRYDAVAMTFTDTFVPAASGGLDGANGLDYGPDGDLYVASQVDDAVRRYDGETGDFVGVFVAPGSGGLDGPTDLTFGPDGNLYVASRYTDSVPRYDGTTGTYLGDFVPSQSGGLLEPNGLEFGSDGHLYVSSWANDSIKRYEGPTGTYIDDFVPSQAGGLDQPRDLVFGPDGHLYVGGEVTNDVKRFEGSTGEPLGVFVLPADGGLSRANDLEFSREGNLYVASFHGDVFLSFAGRSGTFLEACPVGNGLDGPTFLRFMRFCGDGTCDAAIAETVCSCTADCGSPPGTEPDCGDGFDGDCDGSADCADADCALEALCEPAGAVPDGATVPGAMLQVDKAGGGDITLAWDTSCDAEDADYAVYEGFIGLWSGHEPRTCTTGGATSWALTPGDRNRFYLVVSNNGINEGNYGWRSDGSMRPASAAACLAQVVGEC